MKHWKNPKLWHMESILSSMNKINKMPLQTMMPSSWAIMDISIPGSLVFHVYHFPILNDIFSLPLSFDVNNPLRTFTSHITWPFVIAWTIIHFRNSSVMRSCGRLPFLSSTWSRVWVKLRTLRRSALTSTWPCTRGTWSSCRSLWW